MHLRRVAQFVYHPRPPYSFELTVKKPAGWHWFTPFEVWEDRTLWSGFWFGREPIGLKARATGGKKPTVIIEAFARHRLDQEVLERLQSRLGRSLGVDDDLRPLYRLMGRNPMLKMVARRLYGMREGWANDIFPSLSLAVLLQMAPIKRSQEMWDCFIRRYGATLTFDRRKVRLWPTERAVAHHRPAELARACRVGYRAKSLVRLSRQLLAGFPTLEDLDRMTPEGATEKLKELYGVGDYSAGFATPHPSFSLDVWSVKIFHRLIFGRAAPKADPRAAIDKTAAAAEKLWGPWRSYVFTYVLNDLDFLEKKFGIKAE